MCSTPSHAPTPHSKAYPRANRNRRFDKGQNDGVLMGLGRLEPETAEAEPKTTPKADLCHASEVLFPALRDSGQIEELVRTANFPI